MPPATASRKKRGRPRLDQGPRAAGTVQTLDRALTILKLLADSSGLTLTDVAQQAGMSAATAYRLLMTMQKHGFVMNDEAQGIWRVGVETFRAGSGFARGTRVVDVGRAAIRDLMEETGETANLAIEEDGDVVFLSQVESHEAIRAFFRPGERGPMHASGIGKALLAGMPDEQVRQWLHRKGLPRYTAQTIAKPAALFADLEKIRERGYALDDEERHAGMRCVAAAIHNEHGEAVAGASVSGPVVRMSSEHLPGIAAKVMSAADQITNAIGGVKPAKTTLRSA